ncbi:MAG: lycopene cyclase domain-containing protein [Bdellovibrionales bacterium]|nr:lycopene cyclase domain-containing protein [Bdellovibrionales bacterium]
MFNGEMTYLQFLIVFLGVPLAILGAYFRLADLPNKRAFFFGILALVFLAVSYTTPWDNYLVMTKVWWYGEDRVIGTIGYVPIEEYCFFILQTLATGMFCFAIQRFLPLQEQTEKTAIKSGVTLAYTGLFAFGAYGLFHESLTYMGLILAWAMPVLLLQWVIGGGYLLKNHKAWLATAFLPSIYLWFADAYAIHVNIWEISASKTIGVKFGSLPFEEALFFLVTNMMVSQGLILFVVMRSEVADFVEKMRSGLNRSNQSQYS